MISQQLFDHATYSKEVARIIVDLKKGRRLSETFDESGFFQKLDKQMVAVGEKSGDLVGLLHKISLFYSSEINYILEKLFAYLEPFLVIFMGGIIIVLALGIFMPMWNMMEMI